MTREEQFMLFSQPSQKISKRLLFEASCDKDFKEKLEKINFLECIKYVFSKVKEISDGLPIEIDDETVFEWAIKYVLGE